MKTFYPSPTLENLGTNPPKDYVLQAKYAPPTTDDCEMNLIASIIYDNDVYYTQGANVLKEEHFYSELHQDVWHFLTELINDNDRSKPVDFAVLADHMEEALPKYRNSLIANYLLNITMEKRAPQHLVPSYVSRINEIACLRRLAVSGSIITRKAMRVEKGDVKKHPRVLKEEAFQIFKAIFDEHSTDKDIFKYEQKSLDEWLRERKSQASYILPTPYEEFNQMIGGGLKPGSYYILAARPSMGKTTLALNIADYVCRSAKDTHGKSVLFISMEMKAEELLIKTMSSLTGMTTYEIENLSPDTPKWEAFANTYAEVTKDWSLWISNPYNMTSDYLSQIVRRAVKTDDLGLVIIDYIQLMSGKASSRGGSNRTNELSEISRSIKGLALEMDVPMLVLSQLNRNLEERPNKRPILSDLRDSGALEQDADVVSFLYRPEAYSKKLEHRGKAELIIAKNRMGATGSLDLKFEGQHSRFKSDTVTFAQPKDVGAAQELISGYAKKNVLNKKSNGLEDDDVYEEDIW